MRLLTERVAEALERVTLNYRSWEESRLVERGARILESEAQELPRERRLAAEFDARRSLLDGLDALRESHPREVAAAVEAARDYDRLLRVSGLARRAGDRQLSARPAARGAGADRRAAPSSRCRSRSSARC